MSFFCTFRNLHLRRFSKLGLQKQTVTATLLALSLLLPDPSQVQRRRVQRVRWRLVLPILIDPMRAFANVVAGVELGPVVHFIMTAII